MRYLILLTALLAATVTISNAANDVNIEANWAWNGTDQTVQGFKFYLDGTVVQTVADPTARTSSVVNPL